MKNIEILNLANAGVLAITANDLDAAHAYKVLKFKKAVKKAFESILEAEKDIIKEAGIEDAQAFDKERKELMESKANPERLEELNKQFCRFMELRNNLYGEEVSLDCKTLPFEQFHILQKENKGIQDKPLNIFEDALEGVLWEEPKED